MINKNKIKLHFTLKSDNPNEPIYFVKVIVKRAASENHSVPYGHFISVGEKFSKWFYLKLVQLRNTSKKIPTFAHRNTIFSR